MEDVYQKLRVHLDNTPSGYPETESGVEIRILKQLFTKEEAELALSLVMMVEPVEAIAERAGKDPEKIKPVLIEMGRKGTLIHINRNGADSFMLLHFVVGIWEYQVNDLTKELITDFNEYVPYLIKNQQKHKTQQLRVVPVAKSVTTELNVMDYEMAENIIKMQSKIILAPCICRKEHRIMEEGCEKPLETCMVFGGGAYIYESRGIGREITQEEAIEVLHDGMKKGLVVQPSNQKKPINMCLCCGCCCQILKNIKNTEAPAKIVNSSYRAQVDEDECTGCEICVDICPMEAIEVNDETVAAVEADRCIGCGLCVPVCEFEAIGLAVKDDTERWDPPNNLVETYMKIAQEKGLF
ncbi:MAG: 4Fe-4S dicluster domain-containing protein [Desulfobacteraceae bacterium]|nr:4Fe-4S dicluster domain-containing protein [Desulfobacteraceae bacterium]